MLPEVAICPNRREAFACGASVRNREQRRPPRLDGQRWRAALAPVVLVSLLVVSPVLAQTGLNLSWEDCGTSGSSEKAFDCNTNEGSNTLVASFAVETGYCLLGSIGVLDLQSSEAELPLWWQFKNAGSCRQGALNASADFSGGPSTCQFMWDRFSIAAGVASYEVGFGAPNRARIKVLVVSQDLECWPTPIGTEIYAFKLTINNQQTVGEGSCAGCQDGVCVVFNSLQLIQYSGFPRPILDTPLDRSFVTWQAGIPNCPGATPTRNRTWGAIKMLYR